MSVNADYSQSPSAMEMDAGDVGPSQDGVMQVSPGTDDGREWSVLSLPGQIATSIKDGCLSCAAATAECCGAAIECCANTKVCTAPAVITSLIVTVVCGTLTIYGAVCNAEGKAGTAGYFCGENNEYAEAHGTYLVISGSVGCAVGQCAAYFGHHMRRRYR